MGHPLQALLRGKAPLGWTPDRLEAAWDRAGAWLRGKVSIPA